MTTRTVSQPSRTESPDDARRAQLVGGRFEVLDEHGDAPEKRLRARDTKTGKLVALRLLDPAWSQEEEKLEVLRQQVKLATQARHRGIASIYGMGRMGDRGHYVVSEWIEGRSLATLVEGRRAQGRSFSLRAIYNVVTHVAKALEQAHHVLPYGALRPQSVWITDSGRVRVIELGLGAALARTGAWQQLSAPEQACIAPEVRAGQPPDARSDIFGLGALLYVLSTNRFPHETFVQPHTAHPDAGPELDAVVMRCLAQDPAERYASPSALVQALMPLVGITPEPAADDELGVEVEVDVDVAASLRPPAPRPAPEAPSVEAAGPRRPGPIAAAPAASPPAPTPRRAPAPRQAPASDEAPRASEVDFGNLLAKITENDAPRWMVVKEGMDHGPFSGRELVQLILKGEVLDKHGLLNLDTGERKQVQDYPELTEFLQQYKLRKAEQDHQEALARTEKVEKRSNVAKFVILAASVGVLALVGVGYLLTRPEAQEEEVAESDLAALYESGQVKIEGTVGILSPPKHRGRRQRKGRSARSAGGGMSYEAAMNQAMEMGDATKGGGERQLTSSTIAGVMNRKLNSLFTCVGQELRRGGRLGNVKIDLAIAGSGKVLGASVHAGSPAFKSCIAGKVRRISFPSFPAPRMGARYSFAVD